MTLIAVVPVWILLWFSLGRPNRLAPLAKSVMLAYWITWVLFGMAFGLVGLGVLTIASPFDLPNILGIGIGYSAPIALVMLIMAIRGVGITLMALACEDDHVRNYWVLLIGGAIAFLPILCGGV